MILSNIKRSAKLLLKESLWRLSSGKSSKTEAAQRDLLRKRIKELPPLVYDNDKTLGPWTKNRLELRSNIAHLDPRNFLRWPVVLYTMFNECKTVELEYLQNNLDWPLWEKVLPETAVGNPKLYSQYPNSSGNLIHYAYHLARFFENSSVSFKNTKTIFEFGGGYGCMARLISNIGFDGTYVIFDLPEFSALQEYYLSSAGLKVHTQPTQEKGIVILSSLEDLKKQFALTSSLDMFIATWSLSESPIELRKNILKIMPKCSNWLIAYQEKFDGIDNAEYFKKLARTCGDISWNETPIEHIPGSNYLFGKAK